MLIKAKTLTGYELLSLDGEIGRVKEFYFDDRHWVVRYLVADTGSWLSDRQVLISPYALIAVNKEQLHVSVGLTKAQIQDSPSLETHKPVSRQYEQAYSGYYGWPIYWGGPYMWGPYRFLERDRAAWTEPIREEETWDPHLRSTEDVCGHAVQATDGEIGHVQDFIIDDETWAIRYLVIDTRNLWPGRTVIVSPKWIQRVSWGEQKVFVNLTREVIKQSPEYSEEALLTRDYEVSLHGHYNREGYWVPEPAGMVHAR
jgi:hypothetical protein